MTGQSPPTTSGVVIISGSNNFDAHTSDFPVVRGIIEVSSTPFTFDMEMSSSTDTDASQPAPLVITEFNPYHQFDIEMTPAHEVDPEQPGPMEITDFVVYRDISVGFVPDAAIDIDIRSTTVTTSGVVVVDFYPGAGGPPPPPYVPPDVLNARLFPITSTAQFIRVFPDEGIRVFPVLPQFSTLTPGD